MFGIGLAAFLAYDVFSYTLPGILTQLAFLTLGYSAAVHAVSTLDAANKLPPQLSFLRNPPQLPFDAEKIRQFGGMIGERAVGIINKANTLLRWSSPAASGRALAYAWLAYQYNYLLSPAWMLLFWLMAFAAAPAYLMFQRDVEKILSSQALPILQKVQASYSGVSSVLIDAYRKNAAVFPIIVAGVAALFLYVTWGIWSFSSLFTREYGFIARGWDVCCVYCHPDVGCAVDHHHHPTRVHVFVIVSQWGRWDLPRQTCWQRRLTATSRAKA